MWTRLACHQWIMWKSQWSLFLSSHSSPQTVGVEVTVVLSKRCQLLGIFFPAESFRVIFEYFAHVQTGQLTRNSREKLCSTTDTTRTNCEAINDHQQYVIIINGHWLAPTFLYHFLSTHQISIDLINRSWKADTKLWFFWVEWRNGQSWWWSWGRSEIEMCASTRYSTEDMMINHGKVHWWPYGE